MLRIALWMAAIGTWNVVSHVAAQATKTREELVRQDQANFGSLDAWIYTWNVDLNWHAKPGSHCSLLSAASLSNCHQVRESLRTVFRDEGKPIPPRAIVSLSASKVARACHGPAGPGHGDGVESDSAAARSGFRAGDEIMSVDVQPILSTADIQWVLHNVSDQRELPVSIRRNGEPMRLTLELEPVWRSRGDISWRATSWALRQMTTGGMLLQDLESERRADKGLRDDTLALEAVHVGELASMLMPSSRVSCAQVGCRSMRALRIVDERIPERLNHFCAVFEFWQFASVW